MNILETDARKISLALLQPNEGQLEEIGIHANPRQITEDQYQALKVSMQADNLTGAMPLKVYEHEGKYVVLGGNMRLRVLQEMGVKDVPCIVLPKDMPAPVLNKFIITDNSTFGEWDMDALANEWTDEPLKDWGVKSKWVDTGYAPNLNPTDIGVRGVTEEDLESAREHISEELLPNEKKMIEVVCPHCGKTFTIRV